MSVASPFNPSRLDLARRRRGSTKQSLAEAGGVSLRSLVGYCRAEREPSVETVSKFAAALGVPTQFFYGSSLEEPPLEGASFRSFSRLTARLRDQAIAAGALGLSLSDWIDERFRLPPANIPHHGNVDPEAAAIGVRSSWGLGERPIRNMIHLLERQGVRVFSLAEDSTDIDAYSFWRGGTPYVFLNTMKSAERSRMDAAHELGHLVLHRKTGPRISRQSEPEAQRFGSAFLMPRGSVLAKVRRGAALPQIVSAKRHWGVSVAALTYRLHKVGLLSDFQFRSLFATIGRHGYRVEEPNPMPRETSQVLGKVFQALAERGTTQVGVANMLSIYPEELGKLLFGLIRTPLLVK